jgi:hypothetical protein
LSLESATKRNQRVPDGLWFAEAKAMAAMASDGQRPDLDTLAAVIAHSQIVVARASLARPAARRLPAGFEAVDIAILDWIASKGRRASRRYLPI